MDALCSAIRSAQFKDTQPASMRPRYRYLTADTVTAVLHDFSEIFVVQNEPFEVEDIVKKQSGRMLLLGAPSGFFLCLRCADQIEGYSGQPQWCEYGGTPTGQYTLLGQVLRRVRGEGPTYDELRWFMYLGPHGQLLIHHETTDALFVAALNIDELARRGLVGSEILHVDRTMPKTTTSPARLVDEFAALNVRDGRGVAEHAKLRQGRTILLHTPGEGDRPLILSGTEQCLRQWWPFSRASDEDLSAFTSKIIRGLRHTNWKYFGVVGLHVGRDPFRIESVLVIDGCGAIYHVDPDMVVIWRLADDVDQLFRMGLTKVYMPKRRLDRGRTGKMRGEAQGCAHVADAAWENTYMTCEFVHRQYKQQLEWLLREGRFDDSCGTWDETDNAICKTFDTETKEAMRKSVEIADAVDDAVNVLKDCCIGREVAGNERAHNE